MWSPERVLKFTKNRPANGRRSGPTSPKTRKALASRTERGHFVIYSSDGKRFTIPLEHLKSSLIQQLLTMSEEEFGSSCNRRIVVPCESTCMEYIATTVRRGVTQDVETAVLNYLKKGQYALAAPL